MAEVQQLITLTFYLVSDQDYIRWMILFYFFVITETRGQSEG